MPTPLLKLVPWTIETTVPEDLTTWKPDPALQLPSRPVPTKETDRDIHCRFCDWKRRVLSFRFSKTAHKVKAFSGWPKLYDHLLYHHYEKYNEILEYANPDFIYDDCKCGCGGKSAKHVMRGRGLAYYEPQHQLATEGLVKADEYDTYWSYRADTQDNIDQDDPDEPADEWFDDKV